MGTMELSWMARRERCRGCNWYKQSVTVSGEQDYGHCLVDNPRAGGRGTWPIVQASDWCGGFIPRQPQVQVN